MSDVDVLAQMRRRFERIDDLNWNPWYATRTFKAGFGAICALGAVALQQFMIQQSALERALHLGAAGQWEYIEPAQIALFQKQGKRLYTYDLNKNGIPETFYVDTSALDPKLLLVTKDGVPVYRDLQ